MKEYGQRKRHPTEFLYKDCRPRDEKFNSSEDRYHSLDPEIAKRIVQDTIEKTRPFSEEVRRRQAQARKSKAFDTPLISYA